MRINKNRLTIYYRAYLYDNQLGSRGERIVSMLDKDKTFKKLEPREVKSNEDPEHDGFHYFCPMEEFDINHTHILFNKNIDTKKNMRVIINAIIETQSELSYWSALPMIVMSKLTTFLGFPSVYSEQLISNKNLIKKITYEAIEKQETAKQSSSYTDDKMRCFWGKDSLTETSAQVVDTSCQNIAFEASRLQLQSNEYQLHALTYTTYLTPVLLTGIFFLKKFCVKAKREAEQQHSSSLRNSSIGS